MTSDIPRSLPQEARTEWRRRTMVCTAPQHSRTFLPRPTKSQSASSRSATEPSPREDRGHRRMISRDESRFRERITRVSTQINRRRIELAQTSNSQRLLSLASGRRPIYESGIQFAFCVVDRYPNRNLSPRSQFSSGF